MQFRPPSIRCRSRSCGVNPARAQCRVGRQFQTHAQGSGGGKAASSAAAREPRVTPTAPRSSWRWPKVHQRHRKSGKDIDLYAEWPWLFAVQRFDTAKRMELRHHSLPFASPRLPGDRLCVRVNYDLSSSATLDNHNFEIQGFRYGAGYGPGYSAVDADPSQIVSDFTSAQYGVGFPQASIDATTLFGFGGDAFIRLLSRRRAGAQPGADQKEQASSILARWLQLTNTAAVWSADCSFIPYGDSAVTGNGITLIRTSRRSTI